MKYCVVCGRIVEDTAKKCPECGGTDLEPIFFDLDKNKYGCCNT